MKYQILKNGENYGEAYDSENVAFQDLWRFRRDDRESEYSLVEID